MRKLNFLFVFSLFAIYNLFSMGEREKMSGSRPQQQGGCQDKVIDGAAESTVKITGMIQIYGSEPHTFVGIVDGDDVEYAVYPPSIENELRSLQGHLIEFTVIALDEPRGYDGLFLKGGTVTPVKWEIIK